MFRLIFLTFFGKERFDHHKVHVHESPGSMTGPLIILAILSLGGGWVAAPHLMGGTDYFEAFLHPVFAAYAPQEVGVEQAASLAGGAGATGEIAANPSMELMHAITGPPVIVAVLGLLLAWWFYIRKPELPEKLAKSLHAPYVVLYNKYYIDEIYNALFVVPLLFISKNILWRVVDEGMIDGVVNGAATAARGAGGQLRELQSGNARSYATWVVVGAVSFAVLLLALLGVSH
jgi:NADH-quinone oxidoreductase subunit L